MHARETKYHGLHRRDNFEEIVDYLTYGQQKNQVPRPLGEAYKRERERERESPHLTQLDSEGMFELRDMEE